MPDNIQSFDDIKVDLLYGNIKHLAKLNDVNFECYYVPLDNQLHTARTKSKFTYSPSGKRLTLKISNIDLSRESLMKYLEVTKAHFEQLLDNPPIVTRRFSFSHPSNIKYKDGWMDAEKLESALKQLSLTVSPYIRDKETNFLNSNGLVKGKIPKNTPCPFIKDGCSALNDNCPTESNLKDLNFSCAFARAWSISKCKD